MTTDTQHKPPKAQFIDLKAKKAAELIGFTVINGQPSEDLKGKKLFPFVDADGQKKKFFLQNNKTNRMLKLPEVERLVEKLISGYWAGQEGSGSSTGNGESLTFDWNGYAVSAAHRCTAIVLAQFRVEYWKQFRMDDALEGVSDPIVMPNSLLVTGIDPAAADTADIGRPRKNNDVIFRHPEFFAKEPESTRDRLSQAMAKAARLVFVRLRGETDQSARDKIGNEHIKELLDTHPLLEAALVFVYNANTKGDSNDTANKVTTALHSGCTLGVMTGCLYLAGFSSSSRKALEDGKLDLSKRPSEMEKAEEFIDLLGQHVCGGITKDTHPEIYYLKQALQENNGKEEGEGKWGRDQVQTIIARSYLAWRDRVKGFRSVAALRKEPTKNPQRFFIDAGKEGGLDLDKETLIAEGWHHKPVTYTPQGTGDWSINDTVWVDAISLGEDHNWFGPIVAVHPETNTVSVKYTKGSQLEAYKDEVYPVPVSALLSEEPEIKEATQVEPSIPGLEAGKYVTVTEKGLDSWTGVANSVDPATNSATVTADEDKGLYTVSLDHITSVSDTPF